MRKESYDKGEAIALLASVRGRKVPEPTFYRWVRHCFLEPKPSYTSVEIERLIGLVLAIQRGETVDSYQSQLIEEIRANVESRNRQEAGFIDIEATRCG